MIEVNKPTAEAGARVDGAQADVSAATAAHLPALELQPAVAHDDRDYYQLDELLNYHDRAFVARVYTALLKRAPTEAEQARALADLRSGRRSKVEIIEDLLLAARASGQPAVRVAGLSSPLARRVGRWPLVGYVLRLLRGLARVPTLMQHQQQFEAYALGQQPRIADHINGVLTPALADAVESLLMLSDSLIALQTQTQTDLEALNTALRQHLDEALTMWQQQLNEALTAQQQQLDEARRTQAATAEAQQEFLIQEQRVIVETQQVALTELQEQLRELIAAQDERRAELVAELRRLRSLIEPAREQG